MCNSDLKYIINKSMHLCSLEMPCEFKYMHFRDYNTKNMRVELYGSIFLDYVQILKKILIHFNHSVTKAIFRKEQKSINFTNEFHAILLPLKAFWKVTNELTCQSFGEPLTCYVLIRLWVDVTDDEKQTTGNL